MAQTNRQRNDPRPAIEARARALGFDTVGVTTADAVADGGTALARFTAEGRHGDMSWLADTLERRRHPRSLWPAVRGIVVVAANYGPASDPLETLDRRDRATISVYARNRDYHALLKGRLKQLAGFVHGRFGAEVKVFVDTAPVMEKPLAQAAGLGWQGKHTNLVSRALGSWTFLGALFTTLDLAADSACDDHCGQCARCIDICPTQAITGPYRIDARRCISYLTIELKGTIPRDLRPLIGNRIYGCDDCLAVCPWNKFAQATLEPALVARADLMAPRLADLAGLDDAAFRVLFKGSPIKRIGRARFVRNVLIAIGNSGEEALAAPARALLDDSSALVRAMAVWALARLLPGEVFGRLAETHTLEESDTSVIEEWRVATSAR